jgi:hypothetical protein
MALFNFSRWQDPRVKAGVAFALLMFALKACHAYSRYQTRLAEVDSYSAPYDPNTQGPERVVVTDAGMLQRTEADGAVRLQTPEEALDEVNEFIKKHKAKDRGL